MTSPYPQCPYRVSTQKLFGGDKSHFVALDELLSVKLPLEKYLHGDVRHHMVLKVEFKALIALGWTEK